MNAVCFCSHKDIFQVVPDVLEPNRNIIRIGPDGLGMPHKSFYHRLPTDPSVQAYQTFLKDSAQLFGAASPGNIIKMGVTLKKGLDVKVLTSF
jgi:hypothetical protein